MPVYLHPGVYVEEIPSGSKPIDAVGTSTAAFVGFTTQGPIDEPLLITSFDEYERHFGGIQDLSGGDAMGFSVAAFFLNGGTKAYVARTVTGTAASTGAIAGKVSFTAVNVGTWADGLIVRLVVQSANVYTVSVGRYEDPSDNTSPLNVLESFTDVSLTSANARFIEKVLNDGGSEYVTVNFTAVPDTFPANVALTGGNNGTLATDYSNVFAKFLKIRDISTLCLPGQTWNGSNSVIDGAIAHAETMKSRMVIVDPPQGTELAQEADVTSLTLPTSTYSALYYPWVEVANPFFNAETNPNVSPTVTVPPCGYAAAIWAKTDARRGVWKAPAGVENQLLGAAGLQFTVEDAEQDFLNPLGVNALRTLPGYGRVIWGSRTLSTKADPEWRYVPVRRTAIFIEQSIYNGIQWAVFEPNSHLLWSSLRSNVSSFMDGLFRSGAFQGEKASDAYFVRCGLGDTMTQGDVDRGQVIVIVGFAPLKPAEFVIVRIQQKVVQQ